VVGWWSEKDQVWVASAWGDARFPGAIKVYPSAWAELPEGPVLP
jgi:hypothetical protein